MNESDQKRRALTILLDAWDAALAEGVEPEMVASAALFATLTDMVDLHGTDAVAAFVETLPARVRAGEFSPSGGPPS